MKKDKVGKKSWSKEATGKCEEKEISLKDKDQANLNSVAGTLSQKNIPKAKKIAQPTFKRIHTLRAEAPRKKKLSKYRLRQNYWPEHLDECQP
jgi:hypothetical protein